MSRYAAIYFREVMFSLLQRIYIFIYTNTVWLGVCLFRELDMQTHRKQIQGQGYHTPCTQTYKHTLPD